MVNRTPEELPAGGNRYLSAGEVKGGIRINGCPLVGELQGRPGWRNQTLDRCGLRRAERKGDLVLLVLHHRGVAVLVVELNVGD